MTQSFPEARPAVFFDRDGVLNTDKGYVYKETDFEWTHTAKEAVGLANAKGYLAIVITNQSGIARGYYTIADMDRLHQWMNTELARVGARIDAFYACPYHDEGNQPEFIVSNHPDRKPNPGMILRAAAEHNINLGKSFLIGDKPSDIEAANRAGVASVLFSGGDLYAALDEWLQKS